MKQSLLTIVQKILSDMDSEEVNSVADTVEATQVASIVEDTFYNLISNRLIPEHEQLVKLTAVSDSDFPTHFLYPENVSSISFIQYDTTDDNTFSYRGVSWMDPVAFLNLVDSVSSSYVLVNDKNGGTKYRIRTDKMPEFWTTFDDNYIVMDSYKSTVDTTLQQSKTRCYGTVTPVFNRFDDNYVPDIDANMFPLLLNESKSVAMSVLKGSPDPKIDQAARRQRYNIQNNRYKTKRPAPLSRYGR